MRSYVSEGTSICLTIDFTKPVSSFTTVEGEADGYLVPNS
jgi:hypothetical protein